MGVLDKIRLNFYPELKGLGFSDEQLHQIFSNKEFKTQYKDTIKPFIKYLNEFKNTEDSEKSLDENTISSHLKAVFDLSSKNSSSKYVSFVKKYQFENRNVSNYSVLNDSNFDSLYELFGIDIFKDNICSIINSGYADRLKTITSLFSMFFFEGLTSDFFEDKVWNVFISNPSFNDKTLHDLFHGPDSFKIFTYLVNHDLFEGLLYTYENVPSSQNFILNSIWTQNLGASCLEQFSMDFINNVGIDNLSALYVKDVFKNDLEYTKLFEIAKCGNYELIRDIINYNPIDFVFDEIPKEDIGKSLIEINNKNYNKNEVFLNKFFGIEKNDISYVKLFLDAINKMDELPEEYKAKYGDIIGILNHIYSVSEDEIISLYKTFKVDRDRNEFKKLISQMEKDGNEVLKNQFVQDLEGKSRQIREVANKTSVMAPDGSSIDVYELEGQPFAMLVHAVSNNNASIHNSFVEQIIENPELWGKIQGGNNHISTSLISDKYMKIYGVPEVYDKVAPSNQNVVIFGFDKVPATSLKFTALRDAGLSRNSKTNVEYNMRNMIGAKEINTVARVDDVIEKTTASILHTPPNARQWTEIGLTRSDEVSGERLMPNYIVCINDINEASIKASKTFNVPIYLINKTKYKPLPYLDEQQKVEYSEELENERKGR